MKKLRPYQQDALDTLWKRLKETKDPLLINASVGAGKSLIIAEMLLRMERVGYKALCLTMNSTLIEQNAEAYKNQGGHPGIYCASLKRKEIDSPVIFASPHSIMLALKKNSNASTIPFNIIVIDEAHNIDPTDNESMYMQILNHYGHLAQQENYSFRIVGLTGTPYRGKSISIIGESQLFKEQVCSISTSWLISQGFLVKPHFGIMHAENYDFSQINVNSFGKFNEKQLQEVIDKNVRLTAHIMNEVQGVIQSGRNGAFIFAATRKHCEECARSLPHGQWAIITGETAHEERKTILQGAREGNIHYLISVNCLNVGVDVPNFDVCAWLRPTESLVLYTQGIGRVLRLHPGKTTSLVLDYARNLERHGDIDDPIINEALKPTPEKEHEYVIPCYTCGTNNTVHARRCIGTKDDKRCDYFFDFKDCHKCQIKNDITARHCRDCEAELIDPNAKLTKIRNIYKAPVNKTKYWVTTMPGTKYPIINAFYQTETISIQERFFVNSEKSKNITYAKFVRLHVKKPSQYYMKLHSINHVIAMLNDKDMQSPYEIQYSFNEKNEPYITKKIFSEALD